MYININKLNFDKLTQITKWDHVRVVYLKDCWNGKYMFNPFIRNAPFLYPQGFFMFSGGWLRVHWERMHV